MRMISGWGRSHSLCNLSAFPQRTNWLTLSEGPSSAKTEMYYHSAAVTVDRGQAMLKNRLYYVKVNKWVVVRRWFVSSLISGGRCRNTICLCLCFVLSWDVTLKSVSYLPVKIFHLYLYQLASAEQFIATQINLIIDISHCLTTCRAWVSQAWDHAICLELICGCISLQCRATGQMWGREKVPPATQQSQRTGTTCSTSAPWSPTMPRSMAVFWGQSQISSFHLLTQYEWPYKALGLTSELRSVRKED